MTKSKVHAHELIAKLAVEACQEAYDNIMFSNDIRAFWKLQHPGMSEKALRKSWITKMSHHYLPFARSTAAALLAQPIDEELKIQIHEALILDNDLMRGRSRERI